MARTLSFLRPHFQAFGIPYPQATRHPSRLVHPPTFSLSILSSSPIPIPISASRPWLLPLLPLHPPSSFREHPRPPPEQSVPLSRPATPRLTLLALPIYILNPGGTGPQFDLGHRSGTSGPQLRSFGCAVRSPVDSPIFIAIVLSWASSLPSSTCSSRPAHHGGPDPSSVLPSRAGRRPQLPRGPSRLGLWLDWWQQA